MGFGERELIGTPGKRIASYVTSCWRKRKGKTRVSRLAGLQRTGVLCGKKSAAAERVEGNFPILHTQVKSQLGVQEEQWRLFQLEESGHDILNRIHNKALGPSNGPGGEEGPLLEWSVAK